jgi:hypothetical protein
MITQPLNSSIIEETSITHARVLCHGQLPIDVTVSIVSKFISRMKILVSLAHFFTTTSRGISNSNLRV